MAHKIQIKRGNKADLPTLDVGEFGLCQDTNELFIGNSGNQKIFPPTAPTISDVEGLQTALDNKVDNSRVLTNVPVNAKFTDTTYSEISTSEIDAGTSSTLRTITGRRVKYLLDKVQGWINALTKSDIGLGDVENYSIATQAEAEAGTSNTRYTTPLRVKQAINIHNTDAAAHDDIRQQINDLDAEVNDHEIRLVKLEDNIEYKVGSWAEVQDIVRRGLAHNIFTVGDQFVATYGGTEYVWNIIGIDHDTPTDTNYTHSLTIQTMDCLQNVQFDAPEPTNTDANRRQYGNNRYIHSAIKQWLNSNDAVFNWVSQHEFDAAPTSVPYTGAGFLKLLDPELVAVIGAVNKQVAKATIDGGGQDLFSDKVFLLSRKEIYGTDEGTVTGEKAYAFYSAMAGAATDGALAGRIKLLSNAARSWWLRSPYVGYSSFPRIVYHTANVYYSYANYAYGLAPACCIV